MWIFVGGEERVVRCMTWATDWTVMTVLEMGKTRFVS